MRSLLSLLPLVALLPLTNALIPAVLDVATPNLLNAQDHLDKCSDPVTTTVSYDAAYKCELGLCPKNYWKVNENGCCADAAAAKTLGEGVGCCPCGATCTGYMPSAKDWAKRAVLTDGAAEPTGELR